MATTLDSIVQRPFMLNDLAAYMQSLAAGLPPDGWEPEPEPEIFDLVSGGTWQDDAENAPLIILTPKPPDSPQEGVEDAAKAGWMRRVLDHICQCLGKHWKKK
jgi:hypothetical protein